MTSVKMKFDGRRKRAWEGEVVGVDEQWLTVFYERPGHRSEAGEEAVYGLQYFAVGRPLVVLVSFDGQGRVLEYQCDACLPFVQQDRTLEWVDLDLDVMAGPDGAVRLRDVGDFARNAAAMGYDERAIAAAGEGVNLALRLAAEGKAPFDGWPEALLERVLAGRGAG